jgi:CubicO group peptidase (beta-lactamase class C family)
MRILLAALLGAALSASAARAADGFDRLDGRRLAPTEIDREVERLLQASHNPGLALALIEDGRVAYVRAYGRRDLERDLPLHADTIMYGASLTKAAFAYMCMQLVQEGALDLDKPVGAYLKKPLPDYPEYADLAADPRWRKFTPRMLLSHTSGMPNFRWINDDKKLDIKFEPGSRYVYSGEGIRLMQFVLEEGLGLDVGAEMQRGVFDRFHMRRSSMVWRPDFEADYDIGYDAAGKALGHDRRTKVRAAGSLDTTIEDYAGFLAGVARGDGLTPKALDEMLKPQIAIVSKHQFPSHWVDDTDKNRAIGLSYGLGWGLFRTPWGQAFFKEGHDDGTDNYALCVRPRKTCILMLTNSGAGSGMFKQLADDLLGDTGLPWEWEGYTPYNQRVTPLAVTH